MMLAKIIVLLGLAVITPFAIFLGVFLGLLVGAFTGWVVEATPLAAFAIGGFAALGLKVTPEQLPGIGAALGFIGTFFRSTTSHNKD